MLRKILRDEKNRKGRLERFMISIHHHHHHHHEHRHHQYKIAKQSV